MRLAPTPEPTATVGIHPSCHPSHAACDTTDGAGADAFLVMLGLFALCLLIAAVTNKPRSSS